MRVLILGGAGMLGHKLWQVFRDRFDTWVTVRADYQAYSRYNFFDPQRTMSSVDAFDFDSVTRAVAQVQPHVVVNCIGIIKQLPTAHDPVISVSINTLFPHQLANLCQVAETRLIHFSTDCVFSGRKGMYDEEDISDAEDLYGRTKFLGEVSRKNCLTLRTSVIGRELATTHGLLEWFLSHRGGCVSGYTQAIFSGFTSIALAQMVVNIIEQQPDLSGIYHAASEPINKYELLCQLRDAMKLSVEIEPYGEMRVDRSLNSDRFQRKTGYTTPSWAEMIGQLVSDPTPYERWRSERS